MFLSIVACQSQPKTPLQNSFSSSKVTLFNARVALQDHLAAIKSETEIFPMDSAIKQQFIKREQRLIAVQAWQTFLDQLQTLDQLGAQYELIYKNAHKADKKQAFYISYAAFLVRYRYALEFIDFFEHYSAMDTVLNEPVPELELQQGTYKKTKLYYLNSMRSAEFIRLNTLYQWYGQAEHSALTRDMNADIAFIFRAGIGVGAKQTLRNALRIVQDTGFTIWFPLQKEVSEWMGNVKIYRTKLNLITAVQIKEMHRLLQPGDIILERREWFLSNIGLPGYWSHAALYIGTAVERQAYFNKGSHLEKDLLSHYPEAYQKSLSIQKDGQLPRVIEAISEGVTFTTLEHSIAADSVVILRPRLSLAEKEIAIQHAFHFSGRPYDFNFDFLTDSALVCTELIYKVYEPSTFYTGIKFPLRSLMGRQLMTANDIAEMFDKNYGSASQQLDFISFYDGHEWQQQATLTDIDGFRASWKRPKWYKWVQGTAMAAYP
jgi:hypothetical protein